LERVLGPRLEHPAVLVLLERFPTPAQLTALSQKQLAVRLIKLAPRMGSVRATEILQALAEQTVVVHGTQAARVVLPRLAQQLAALRAQREDVAKEIERLVLAHPLNPVLTSMPGVGIRTAARLLLDVVSRGFAWRPTWPRMLGSPRSHDARARPSAANIPPDGATSH
jgi:hypothetical protein